MFEKIIEKANEAATRLSKTLSLFEKEFTDLRVKFTEELMDFQDKSDLRTKTQREELEKIYLNYNEKFKGLVEDYKKRVSDLTVDSIALFSQETKTRFEGLYIAYEEEAKKRALQTFDTDLVVIFEKYGDRIVPLIFKSLLRYIFRIKK